MPICLQVGQSLEAECGQLSMYSPVFEVGGVIASVKVTSEAKLVEAGSSIVGGLDRVFKLFWIMNMAYPAECCNMFKFFEYFVYCINGQKAKIVFRDNTCSQIISVQYCHMSCTLVCVAEGYSLLDGAWG